MGYEIHTEKGLVNRGNLYRMKELMISPPMRRASATALAVLPDAVGPVIMIVEVFMRCR